MSRIAFIGLGNMGLPMATRLIDTEHELVVNDIDRSRAESLLAQGAQFADSPADAARGADVVLSMLPADQHVKSVTLGDDGIAQTISSGAVYIDFSTISPTTIVEINEELGAGGVRMFDVAVGPGVDAAAAGRLTLMAGGDRDLIDSCDELLAHFGGPVIHCGGLGSGKAVKIANNLVTGITTVMNAEAFVLATKAGADPAILAEVMNGTMAGNKIATLGFPRQVFSGAFVPGFKLSLMRKDVGLAVQLAQELDSPQVLSELVLATYDEVLDRGWADEDLTSYVKHVEEKAGVEVRTDRVPSYLQETA